MSRPAIDALFDAVVSDDYATRRTAVREWAEKWVIPVANESVVDHQTLLCFQPEQRQRYMERLLAAGVRSLMAHVASEGLKEGVLKIRERTEATGQSLIYPPMHHVRAELTLLRYEPRKPSVSTEEG
jgi:hypothetical protein